MKKGYAAAVILSLLLLLPSPQLIHGDDSHPASSVSADSTPSESPDKGAGYLPYSDPTPLGSGGFFGAIIRTIFSLAIVIGLLYAVLWAIRKFTGGAAGPFSEGAVRLVGRVYLSPKVVIYFLRLADELLVIGTNAGNITLLTTIKDENQMQQIENSVKSVYSPASGLTFSGFLDKSLSKFQKTLGREDSLFDDQLRMLNDQIGRLRGLARKKRQGDEE